MRDLDERFESRLLPLFTRRTREVRDLLPELYLHGLASGDFELALSGLLGEQAPLSASTVARAKERWQAEYSEWQQRRIEDEIVYLWLDGVYLKAGLEKEKAALLVAIGVKPDGHKVVLAVSSGYRESTASWSGLLRALKARGMNEPRLVVGDGNLGLWSALRNAAARAAGIDGRITGHSGRVGLASELTARGASATETMHPGGWKTARCAADAPALCCCPSTGLLLVAARQPAG